jgi:hypothetical protein
MSEGGIGWVNSEPLGAAVGVHTPEFPFEGDPANVRRAVAELDVHYPVAIDADYAIWEAFANRYWLAAYIVDAQGRIRHHQFGEGGYEDCERTIQRFLREAGRQCVPEDLVTVEDTGLEAQADWDDLRSPAPCTGRAAASPSASTPATSTSSSALPPPTSRSRSR